MRRSIHERFETSEAEILEKEMEECKLKAVYIKQANEKHISDSLFEKEKILKEAGILCGEDARRFEERMNNVEKVSEEKRKRIFDTYDKIRDRTVQDVYDFCKDKISLLVNHHKFQDDDIEDSDVAFYILTVYKEIQEYIKARSSDLKI